MARDKKARWDYGFRQIDPKEPQEMPRLSGITKNNCMSWAHLSDSVTFNDCASPALDRTVVITTNEVQAACFGWEKPAIKCVHFMALAWSCPKERCERAYVVCSCCCGTAWTGSCCPPPCTV